MAQAETVAIPNRWPMVIEPDNRDETTATDARVVNCYVEAHRENEKQEYWIYKRGGNALYSQVTTASTGLGVYNWLGDIYSIFGTTFYKNGVSQGTVDGTTSYRFSPTLGELASPSNLSTQVPVLALSNGVALYSWDGTTLTTIPAYGGVSPYAMLVGTQYWIESVGTTNFMACGASANTVGTLFTCTAPGFGTGYVAVSIASLVVGATYQIQAVGTSNFLLCGAVTNTVGTVFVATAVGTGTGAVWVYNAPLPHVKAPVYLDGVTYVGLTNAHIQGTAVSTLNSVLYWDPLNSLIAQIEPDNMVAMAKQLVYVIALKQWTTEVFYDAGNPTGSLLSSVPGAKVGFGCAHQDSVRGIDDVLFWLSNTRSANIQVIMMEGLKAQIISTKAIEKLLEGASLVGCSSWTLKDEGHIFYGVTLPSPNLTLVYDYKDKLWHQWTDTAGNYWPYVDSTFDIYGNHLFQHNTNGALYYYSRANLTDPDGPIQVMIVTPNFDGGTRRRKMLNCVEFVGDQTTGSTLQVSYNDADYNAATWSTPRTVDMGLQKPALYSNGTFIKRAYKIQHTAVTRFRLQAMELQVDVGTL